MRALRGIEMLNLEIRALRGIEKQLLNVLLVLCSITFMLRKPMKLLLILSCFTLLCFPKSHAVDLIKPNQTLVSTGKGTFELGFFSPRNSKNRFVGIGFPIWSSNSSAKNPSLELLDSGNLVVKDGISGSYVWQSFDHSCDTQRADMKLGWDFVTGQNWYLASWNSLQDPSIGNYTYKVDPRLP
ncbi:Bulb-type lectin domain containing protein [Parasponia andersonii]|uniref:Bulb-type lectin domain containing protein n=1 Tax=Parasponia andersonii TaxID=3476 RepID=A0A2P5A6H0_PARAD|nr:Bulb-type lectin domain containing protein [Parasponia andersonii]